MQNAPREHSAILSTFIKLPFVFKTFVLSIFEWPLKTGFTVIHSLVICIAECPLFPGVPRDQVDVVELHDCFSCNELITYEALGLCEPGKCTVKPV